MELMNGILRVTLRGQYLGEYIDPGGATFDGRVYAMLDGTPFVRVVAEDGTWRLVGTAWIETIEPLEQAIARDADRIAARMELAGLNS